MQHGTQYIYNTFIQDPTRTGKPTGDAYVYAVGDAITESALWRRPEDVAAQGVRKLFGLPLLSVWEVRC